MENIFETVKRQAEDGAQIKVDFKARVLSINGKKVDLNKELGIPKYGDLNKWLDSVEQLYDNYKYSRPTSGTMRKRMSKFKALSTDELIEQCGRNALSNPIDRNTAQAVLETFILLSMENGSFKPEELFKDDWYFQGADKSLVMLKNWFI